MFIKKKSQNLFKKPIRFVSVAKALKKNVETPVEGKKEEEVVVETPVEKTETIEETTTPKKQQGTKKTASKKQEETKETEK